MTAELAERTVLPPSEPMDDFALLLSRAAHAELVTPEGERMAIPPELFQVLRTAVTAMSNGQAVTVAPHHQALTTQEAADLLGISRPTLVKLVDGGVIPSHRPGRHRRVLLRDVLAYQEKQRYERRVALDEIVEVSEEAGLYDLPAAPRRTR